MNQERSHCQDRSLWGEAIYRDSLGAQFEYLIIDQYSELVSSWKDTQGAVLFSGIVEMNSKRNNLIQDVSGSVRVDDPFLD